MTAQASGHDRFPSPGRTQKRPFLLGKRQYKIVKACTSSILRFACVDFRFSQFLWKLNSSMKTLQDVLELTSKKDVLFIIGDWNAKVEVKKHLEQHANLALEYTAHWGRRSRTTPRFPRHREMRAFVSCVAQRPVSRPLSKRLRRLDSLESTQ